MNKNLSILLILFLSSVAAFSSNICDSLLLNWDKTSNVSFQKRRQDLEQIIIVLNNQSDTACLSNAYRRLGTLYRKKGLWNNAIQAFVQSIQLAEAIREELSAASCCNQLGTIYHELKNQQWALEYFTKAYHKYEEIHHLVGMSISSFNLAETHELLGEHQEALQQCQHSMELRRQTGDTTELGSNYALLGHIELNRGDPARAKEYTETALGLLRRAEDWNGLIPALYQMADVVRKAGKEKESLHFIAEGLHLATQLQFLDWQKTGALKMADAYQSLARYDSAFYYQRLATMYNDTLETESQREATEDAATRYHTEEKEKELSNVMELLKKYELLILVFIFLLLAIGGWLLLRKRIARKEQEIRQMNALIQGQDEERERIARELHDRVGSMLSAVKLHFSNMDAHMDAWRKQQAESYQVAVQLLDETCEEVRRISHDLDAGLLKRFGLRTALLQLTKAIESANRIRIQFIDNELKPELYKAYETDLYRISQELLSNSMKYARASEISIQLSRANGHIFYSYEDDGVGFDTEALKKSSGMGYRNIEGRVQKMKGKWHIESRPGSGMNLIIELPLYG